MLFSSRSPPPLQLACWRPRGAWCHPDPSVALPVPAPTLLSELEKLASIYPWLLANVSEGFGIGITFVCLL